MKSPICVTNIRVTNRKQTASFSIVGLMLAIVPLWLMLAFGSPANAQTSTTDTSPDWTQFHRDNMQRWNPYETVLGVNNVGSLALMWAYPIGTPLPDEAISSPAAVVNGVVYVGSSDGHVYALDASTGTLLWSQAIEIEEFLCNCVYPITGGIIPTILASPAVADGVVYIGSSDNNLYALNASTGAKLWSYTTGGGIGSSPAVVNGVVYFGSTDNNVYALNASTGAKLWSYDTGNQVWSSPAVVNGVVYFGSTDYKPCDPYTSGSCVYGNVYALNASTGAKLWSYATELPVISSPAVANGVVYVGSGDYDPCDPEPTPYPPYRDPCVSGNVYALNASTGAKLWSYTTGGGAGSSPAVANGVVYVGTYDYDDPRTGPPSGELYALNASTGALLWTFFAPGEVQSSPAVANGVVYFGALNYYGGAPNSQFFQDFALNASTGAVYSNFAPWNYSPANPQGTPTVVNGTVYFGPSAFRLGADLFLRIQPTPTTVQQGDLITYAFPVWNLGPVDADHEVLNTQVPAGTTFDNISISGTPGLGTCTTPPYGGTGQIVCHENSVMAPNTTWTVRLTVKVTAAAGSTITANAATMADTPDPNLANNTATVSTTVLGDADLFLCVLPSTTTVHQGDLLTYAFPVWNLGPSEAALEVLNTQVPAGTTFDYIRISGTPGLGTCTTPAYGGTGPIVCHENGVMAPNTTWTVRVVVKVTAPAGTVITENAAVTAYNPDPNPANNTATVSMTVQ